MSGTGGDRRSPAARQRYSHPGNPLWEYRVAHGMSQQELADMLLVYQPDISNMERGKEPIRAHIMDFLEEQGGKQK